MKIQTLTAVVGGSACNAHCKFCVSKMTPPNGVTPRAEEPLWANFHIACKLAKASGVTTFLLTGKGEPTLWPHLITEYLTITRDYDIPLVELQTNGIPIARWESDDHIRIWWDLGLRVVAISIVHWQAERNREQYAPHGEYIDLPKLIARLRALNFSVRLTCTMVKGYVDTWDQVDRLIDFARENKVAQLTIRPVARTTGNDEIASWIRANELEDKHLDHIEWMLGGRGTPLMTLPSGGTVYDYEGQNVCLTDCLTIKPEGDDLRQLIFFPDGRLSYDWRYEGARIL